MTSIDAENLFPRSALLDFQDIQGDFVSMTGRLRDVDPVQDQYLVAEMEQFRRMRIALDSCDTDDVGEHSRLWLLLYCTKAVARPLRVGAGVWNEH